MRIKRVFGENIFQHERVDQEIHGSVIAITGPNGKGKSNFLHMIAESFHGEFHQSKDRMVRWGVKTGFMGVDAVMPDGSEFTVTRRFPSGDAEVVCGEEKIIKPAKVNAWILNKLGTDKATLENFVFVGQKDTDAILFSRPLEKERIAARFFNVGGATIIEGALTKALAEIAFDSLANRLDDLRRDLVAANNDHESAVLEASKLRTAQEVDYEISHCEDELESFRAGNMWLERVAAATASARQREAEYEELNTDYRQRYDEYLKMDAPGKKTMLARHRAEESVRGSRARTNTLLAQARKELESLPEDADPEGKISEAYRETIDSKLREMGDLSGRIKSISSMLDGMKGVNEEGVCSTCGSKIDISSKPKLEKDIESLREAFAAAKMENASASRSLAVLSEKIASRSQKRSALAGIVEKYEKDLGLMPEGEPALELSIKELEQDVENCTRALTILNERYNRLSAAKDAKEKALQDLQSITDQAGKTLPEKTIDLAPAQARLAALRKELGEIGKADERVRSTKQSLEFVKSRIGEAEKACKKNEKEARVKQVFEKVRKVYHPNGAPKTLITRNTRLLESRINHYLGAMRASFVVEAKEGFNFDAIFPNGIARDSELSVGQKAALSWSFRLSGCETFSSSVGLMTMDEPTAPMDDDVLMGFIDVIGIMKGMSATHGMQFFIATHSIEVANACDQTIRIGS